MSPGSVRSSASGVPSAPAGHRPSDVLPTGERFIPELMGGQLIEAEHHVRYRHLLPLVGSRTVLDAGCGVGWGSALLASAGAASVTGVDISPEAIQEARSRRPEAGFACADLLLLPFSDSSFDIVVCFEALEHVNDPFRVLDELRRVTRPGGVLAVSSPNPAVYPAGNPFHVHELPPEELLGELARRFRHTSLWQQQPMMASVLRPWRDAPGFPAAYQATLLSMSDPASAPYSLVLATDGELPEMGGTAAVVSARQLTGLEEFARSVEAERRAYQEDHQRIVAERQVLLAEHAAAHAESARLAEEAREARRRLEEMRSRLERLEGDLLESLRDRDRTLLLLLEAEQDVARLGFEPTPRPTPRSRPEPGSLTGSPGLGCT